jgi:hypothetical protein
MSREYALNIHQGSTLTVPIRWYTDATATVLRDLSTYTARMHVRERYSSAETVLEIENGDGITLSDGSGGENIEISVSDTVTAALPAPFSGVFDLEVVSAGGVVTKVLYGPVKIRPEVTR